MGWIITFAVLLLLAILPLGAAVHYDADGLRVRVIAGPLRVTVIPMRPKKPKKKKEAPKQPKPKPAPKPAPDAVAPEKKKGGSVTDFLPLVKIALELLGDFRRRLRLNNLEMKLILAGGDPCDLAVNYGRAWASLGNLLPLLEKVFVIKKRNLEVECDFTASQTTVIANLDISITLGRLIALTAVYGFRGLKEFLKIMKKRKGGAVK